MDQLAFGCEEVEAGEAGSLASVPTMGLLANVAGDTTEPHMHRKPLVTPAVTAASALSISDPSIEDHSPTVRGTRPWPAETEVISASQASPALVCVPFLLLITSGLLCTTSAPLPRCSHGSILWRWWPCVPCPALATSWAGHKDHRRVLLFIFREQSLGVVMISSLLRR